MKDCSSCKQEINDAAGKCHYCGSAQGHLKIINTVSIYIGTILAVISLSAIGIQAVNDILDSKNSELSVKVLDTKSDQFNFIVSNKGSRAGVIYDLTFKYPDAMECDNTVTFEHRVEFDNKVVEAGKTYSFSKKLNNVSGVLAGFEPHVLASKKLSTGLEKFKVCSMTLTYVDFNNVDKTIETKFHCLPQGKCSK